MTLIQKISFSYAIILTLVTSLNYLPIPGITDADGRAFGIFALDIFDDALHASSALWALVATFISHRASKTFLLYFGSAYFADGLLGLLTGSGYLDFGIFIYGFFEYPSFLIKLAANIPHLALGGVAVFSAIRLNRS
ncbi:MAG: hypothetical protein ABJ327_24615 [Litoreibacter sp.]